MWLVRKETPDCVSVKEVKCDTEDEARQAMRALAGEPITVRGHYLIHSDVVNGFRYTAIEVGAVSPLHSLR